MQFGILYFTLTLTFIFTVTIYKPIVKYHTTTRTQTSRKASSIEGSLTDSSTTTCSGVFPVEFWSVRSAPDVTSSSTRWASPRLAHRCSALSPSEFVSSTSKPFSGRWNTYTWSSTSTDDERNRRTKPSKQVRQTNAVNISETLEHIPCNPFQTGCQCF